MRVIATPPPDTDADLLTAFRRHLVARDLAPATVRAYLESVKIWGALKSGERIG